MLQFNSYVNSGPVNKTHSKVWFYYVYLPLAKGIYLLRRGNEKMLKVMS